MTAATNLDTTGDNLLTRYEEWRAHRKELNKVEEDGMHVPPSDWENSDDAAVDLMHDLAHALRVEREDRTQ